MSIALQDPASAKSSREPTPFLDPDLFFELSVPVYPIMSYAWIPEGVDWINELEALDQVETWSLWWLTRPLEYPYSTCLRPCNQGFHVFAPVGSSESEVESLIVEDADEDEAYPPVVDLSAPEPESCDGMQIFVDDFVP